MELMKKQTVTGSQKLMIFVLTMALYGLATLFTELIPSFQAGVVEFSVEYFLFIPLTLAMLFDPLSAALGAATGELVSDKPQNGRNCSYYGNRSSAAYGNAGGYRESAVCCRRL